MAEAVRIEVPPNSYQPVAVATLKLGPGMWDVTYSSNSGGNDVLVLMARRVENDG